MSKLIKKNSGTGTIVSINKGYVFIVTPTVNNIGNNCNNNKQTKVCGGCGGCSSAQNKNKNYDEKIYVGKNIAKNIIINARVNFVKHTIEPNFTSFLIFGTPIIFSIASIIIVTNFSQIKIDSTLGISIIIISFFAGIIFTSIVDKIFKRVCPSQLTEIQRLTENEQGGSDV